MSQNEIHKNDIGTRLEITVMDGSSAVDISGATTKQIKLEKPGGSTVAKDGTFTTDGSDGKIYYVTQEGDLGE